MKILIIITLLFSTFSKGGITFAQTNGGWITNGVLKKHWNPELPLGATNWGKRGQSARLQIILTNDVVTVGSYLGITAVISNFSVGEMVLAKTGPRTDYEATLTDGKGRNYILTEGFVMGSVRRNVIAAGHLGFDLILAEFGTNIESGDYLLKATRKLSDKSTLESNSLMVQVKRGGP